MPRREIASRCWRIFLTDILKAGCAGTDQQATGGQSGVFPIESASIGGLTVARSCSELFDGKLLTGGFSLATYVRTTKVFGPNIHSLCALAGNSLLVYDYLLTVPLEVAYIWNSPWTLVKALFLINRYGNLLGQTFITLEEISYISHGSQEFCAVFQLYCTTFWVLSVLMVMRTCAILRCRRSIAMLLQALYVLYALGLLVIVNYLMNGLHPQFEYVTETGVCFGPIPLNSWLLWITTFFLDGSIFVIVCYNLWQLSSGSHSTHPLQLIHLLARDALLFYFAALFNVLFSILCWTIDRQNPEYFIQTLISSPILSIVGQRVILNLREFWARPHLTRDLSREVDRQIAAMVDQPSWRTIQMVDLFLDNEADQDPEQVIL